MLDQVPGWSGSGRREDGAVAPLVLLLVRHAEPRAAGETPAAGRPLTDKGRRDARALGTSLAGRWSNASVLSSPERRARETAALAFPGAVAGVRDHLNEVNKPWYASGEEHAVAVAGYLKGDELTGWERRADVISRLTQLRDAFGSSERLVLVTHGLLLTTWVDHETRLDDPMSFWSDLRMPDAWELTLGNTSLERVSSPSVPPGAAGWGRGAGSPFVSCRRLWVKATQSP